jgi:hypothetical protein
MRKEQFLVNLLQQLLCCCGVARSCSLTPLEFSFFHRLSFVSRLSFVIHSQQPTHGIDQSTTDDFFSAWHFITALWSPVVMVMPPPPRQAVSEASQARGAHCWLRARPLAPLLACPLFLCPSFFQGHDRKHHKQGAPSPLQPALIDEKKIESTDSRHRNPRQTKKWESMTSCFDSTNPEVLTRSSWSTPCRL